VTKRNHCDSADARSGGVEPAGVQAIVSTKKRQEAIMRDHWPISTERVGAIHQDTSEDTVAYAAGWTVSGLATLVTILAVWVFAI
jgi:hypothetical protein